MPLVRTGHPHCSILFITYQFLLVVDCMFVVLHSPCRLTMGTPSPKPPPPGRTPMVLPPLAGSVKCYVLVHREMVVRKEPHTSLLWNVFLVFFCNTSG